MATSFKKSCAYTASLSAPDTAAGHCRLTPLLETPGHSQASLGQSLVGSLLISLGSGARKVLFVPSKSLFPQSCESSTIKSHLTPKSNSLGVLSPFARSPGWVILELTNRFKRLDLIDRVPEELWMEVCDIVQEAGTKTIPKKKKGKKEKCLSEEALQTVMKRREAKGKGKERYTHLNAEFQRIARRDKKGFFSDQ